jgi:hypothetical protein
VIGRLYLDPGSRLSGRHNPPCLCRILTRWGRGGGPRNVAVEYLDDGSHAVIPFTRRLRRTTQDGLLAKAAKASSGDDAEDE